MKNFSFAGAIAALFQLQTLTITGAGNYDIDVEGATTAALYVSATSGLTFTLKGTFDGSNFFDIDSSLFSTSVEYTAGATITPTQGQSIEVPCAGFVTVRVVRSGGTGTIVARPVGAATGGLRGSISGSGAEVFSSANYQHVNGIYQPVSNVPLRALGATNWTGASGRTAGSKGLIICNPSKVDYLYYLPFTATASIPAITQATAIPLAPQSPPVVVRGDENIDVAFVREFASTDNAIALEFS